MLGLFWNISNSLPASLLLNTYLRQLILVQKNHQFFPILETLASQTRCRIRQLSFISMGLIGLIGKALLAVGTWVLYKWLYQIVYYRFFHPLKIFPGLFWGSVTRLWLGYRCVKVDECEVVIDLHKKHGM